MPLRLNKTLMFKAKYLINPMTIIATGGKNKLSILNLSKYLLKPMTKIATLAG